MPNKPENIKASWVPERIAFGRRKDNSKFYNARKWRNTAARHKEANPLCAECLRNNKNTLVKQTDHIRGLQFLLDNGLDPYADEELESACTSCHNKKSGRDAHKKGG